MPKTQILPLPLNSIPYQNVSEMTLDNLSDELFDGYIDEFGNTNKRPGLAPFSILGTEKSVDGLYSWEIKKLILNVSDGFILTTDSSMINTDITGDKLVENVRPTYAQNGVFIVLANSGKMVYTDGTVNTIAITDPQAPSEVTHVGYLDFYLLAFQKGTSLVRFADFENIAPTGWNFDDFFVAESQPDGILSMYIANGIIYLFGESSIEFWVNDGVSPFRRINTQRERGVMSPYCTVLVNDSFYFFDNRRRLTLLNGFTAKIINTSFDKTIANFETVDDCLADYITVLGKNWLMFTFPTENKTLFYDLNGPGTQYWAEWSTWDQSTGSRDRFLLNCHTYSKFLNKHLVGSYQGDKVLNLTDKVCDDDGINIHFLKRTGNIDYEVPYQQKVSYNIIVRMLSGIGLDEDKFSDATARIRWRDNGSSTWSNYTNIQLSQQGRTEFLKRINSNGSYYTRQYEISMTDNAPFVMAKSFERLDINEF
jgi:hypothetical protein